MNDLTARESLVLSLLREYQEYIDTEADGSQWGSIYLDNARPDDMSPRTFAGILSSLEKKGLYKPHDGYAFGYVRMT